MSNTAKAGMNAAAPLMAAIGFPASRALVSMAHSQVADVEIALIAPTSGGMARQGELMRIGAQLAIDDVNARGGIAALKGVEFKLVIEDAGDKVETDRNAAQRLVARERDIAAGTESRSSSLAPAVTGSGFVFTV